MAEQNPALTVIMPVYNKEAFLPAALDAVLAQTLADLEIVCVDNNSTDGSASVVRAYAAKDPRVRLVSATERQGAAYARNVGLDAARGDYVGFCDADDVIDPTMYETLVRVAADASAEVAFCGIGRFNDDAPGVTFGERVPSRSGSATVAELGGEVFSLTTPSACPKVFWRGLIDRLDLRFDEALTVAEDFLFTYTAILSATRLAFVDKPLYWYRQQVGESLTAAKGRSDVFVAHERVLAMLRARDDADAFMDGYLNFFITQADWALQGATSFDDFAAMHAVYRDQWADLVAQHADTFDDYSSSVFANLTAGDTPEALLFAEYKRLLTSVADHQAYARQLKASKAFRAGTKLLQFPRWVASVAKK